MRLTSSSVRTPAGAPRAAGRARPLAAVAIVVALAVVFVLDRATADAPVQHLYYLPIAFAAVSFGYLGGLAAALAAIGLYHLANGFLYAPGRGEADIVQVVLFILVGVVVAKLSRDAARLRWLASTDDLTGLHNLRSFEACLAELLRTARKTRTPLALLVLDVDHLKALNDRYGHLTGAEAVRMVGHVIAAQIPADAVACRYGGDEFVIALPGHTTARAEQVALALRRVVHDAAPTLAGHALPAGALAVSIGIACRSFVDRAPAAALRSDQQEGESLFRAADAALYRAKDGGRNRVCCA
jgi:diguanylate cyclase (GGDEF)-like protein